MIIKKYVVDEMQQAVKKIKEEMGPEAIIVSSQKVRGKGLMGFFQTKIEVTAVLDETRELPAPPQRRELVEPKAPVAPFYPAEPTITTVQRPQRANVARVAEVMRTTDVPNDAPTVHHLRSNTAPIQFKPVLEEKVMKSMEQQEKERLLTMLEKQLDKFEHGNKDFFRRWLKLLTATDIEQGIAEQLLTGLAETTPHLGKGDQDELIKITLTSKVADLIQPAYQQSLEEKFMIFIGQPGVGKTTTLAKLATRFKLLEGKEVALITVYSYRYGTADQLKIYGETMDVPVEVVMTPAELRQAVERHADKDYILIDTVGRSSKNTGQVLELKGFIDAIDSPKQVYLVLNASTKNRDLFRTINDFKIVNYNRYIFTKVDETETLGSMLNVVLKTGVPIQYYTEGQTIPDDIAEVQPRQLAQLLFKGVDLDANQIKSS